MDGTEESDVAFFSQAVLPISSWAGLKFSAVTQGSQDTLVSPISQSCYLRSRKIKFMELNFSAMCSVTVFVVAKQEEGLFFCCLHQS